MSWHITPADRFGLVRPAIDVHTLGITSIEHLLRDCGYESIIADAETCEAFGTPAKAGSMGQIVRWIRENRITILAFSFRLDPEEGVATFSALLRTLKLQRLLAEQGGPIRAVFFAGLPQTCQMVKSSCPEVAGVFSGEETPADVLWGLKIDPGQLPRELSTGISYDEDRLAFGRDLIRKGDYAGVKPVDRADSPGFGTPEDSLVKRLLHGKARGLPPLIRAHVGPYIQDRAACLRLFLRWSRKLAKSGLLDVLSIGTSQLSQSNFAEDWMGRSNGGGVPLNSPEEFEEVWRAARPMLVRTYAGTKDIPALARMYERTIHMAWHALSFWWFCRMDGRGPNAVRENLNQHWETLKYIASSGKPFEPNIPHHFAFRGADDATCLVSALLAAKAAKRVGVRCLVLQTMLNTPKFTWGVQDLAKARALLCLVRELESERFKVILQPRGGLDYFSTDLDKAKAQLAAATALMDDIEPGDSNSPAMIHVVSYCEASHLANPEAVLESIKITRHALQQYRLLRTKGAILDMSRHPEVQRRTVELVEEVRTILRAIESSIAHPYSPEGFYQILAKGFLPVPDLWGCLGEFQEALLWKTRMVRGSVKIVDEKGAVLPAVERMKIITTRLAKSSAHGRGRLASAIKE